MYGSTILFSDGKCARSLTLEWALASYDEQYQSEAGNQCTLFVTYVRRTDPSEFRPWEVLTSETASSRRELIKS